MLLTSIKNIHFEGWIPGPISEGEPTENHALLLGLVLMKPHLAARMSAAPLRCRVLAVIVHTASAKVLAALPVTRDLLTPQAFLSRRGSSGNPLDITSTSLILPY